MGKRADKHNKRCADHPRDGSKLTCLIYGPGRSSYECKVLNDFGAKYSKYRHFKESSQEPIFKTYLEISKR